MFAKDMSRLRADTATPPESSVVMKPWLIAVRGDRRDSLAIRYNRRTHVATRPLLPVGVRDG